MSKLIIALALIASCKPPIAPAPDADASALLGDAGPCQAAAANLARIGCAVGSDPEFVTGCLQNLAAPITAQPLGCWADAGSKEAARACGELSCP